MVRIFEYEKSYSSSRSDVLCVYFENEVRVWQRRVWFVYIFVEKYVGLTVSSLLE